MQALKRARRAEFSPAKWKKNGLSVQIRTAIRVSTGAKSFACPQLIRRASGTCDIAVKWGQLTEL